MRVKNNILYTLLPVFLNWRWPFRRLSRFQGKYVPGKNSSGNAISIRGMTLMTKIRTSSESNV